MKAIAHKTVNKNGAIYQISDFARKLQEAGKRRLEFCVACSSLVA